MKLLARAPGKINLSLFLGRPRPGGRHALVTVLESVSLADELELTVLDADGSADEVVCRGVQGVNLIAVALAALRRRGWDAPPVRIEVVKRIPVAAGMGGGSADAAGMLRLAVELAPGRPEEIAALAAELGSDVPSQLAPGLVVATGTGELVEPYEPIAPHATVIVPQPFALATADVYREADRLGLGRDDDELDRLHDDMCKSLARGARLPVDLLVNDLQPAALSLRPELAGALEAIRDAGAGEALVSGSGPTAVGLFWGADARQHAATAGLELESRFPQTVVAAPVGSEFGWPQPV